MSIQTPNPYEVRAMVLMYEGNYFLSIFPFSHGAEALKINYLLCFPLSSAFFFSSLPFYLNCSHPSRALNLCKKSNPITLIYTSQALMLLPHLCIKPRASTNLKTADHFNYSSILSFWGKGG